MKITHIFHSGFSIELEHSTLLFDYYEGRLPSFDPQKTLYVFASHEHHDHYDPVIWTLKEQYPKIFYILDEDVAPEHWEALHVQARKTYHIGEIRIRTLLSTDEGVAFYVEAEGHRIYHSGDLNVWSWERDTDQRNMERRQIFRDEIQVLKGRNIEAAFVPLDPRLGENAPDAVRIFMEEVGCQNLFPMHYWERQDEIRHWVESGCLQEWKDKIHFEDEAEI